MTDNPTEAPALYLTVVQLAAGLELPAARLQAWITRGVIPLRGDGRPGVLVSPRQLAALVVAASFSKTGAKGRHVGHVFSGTLAALEESSRTSTPAWLLADGEYLRFVLLDPRNEVAVRELVQGLRGRIVALSRLEGAIAEQFRIAALQSGGRLAPGLIPLCANPHLQ